MKSVNLFYLKLTQSLQSVKSLAEILILGVAFVFAITCSLLNKNTTLNLVSGITVGLLAGIILAKTPAIIAWFKANRPKSIH